MKDPQKDFSNISFGWVTAATFFFYCGLGYWLDQKYKTGFIWTAAGFIVGILLLIYEVWKILKNINNNDKARE